MGVYFDANSNVFKAVLEAFDFEVTVIVATQSVPAVNPVTVVEQRPTKRSQRDSKRRRARWFPDRSSGRWPTYF